MASSSSSSSSEDPSDMGGNAEDFPGRFVLELSPPSSVFGSATDTPTTPFELTFHNRDTAAKSAQQQWLIDTHRIWRSIADTPEAERRDERWMVAYSTITSAAADVTADHSSNSTGLTAGKEEASDSESRPHKRRKKNAADRTAALSTLYPVLDHPPPSAAHLSSWQPHFRSDSDAVHRLRSFEDGFFGRFITRVQKHNSELKEADVRLDLLIGGSAPLAATCRVATFQPHDVDLYMRHINNTAVTALDRVIRSLLTDPAEQSVVLLRKPLTLTWAIYQRKRGAPLTILHRLQLNLMQVHSWAEVFAVYHSDLVCAGYDVGRGRLVVLYDRWWRFYSAVLSWPTSLPSRNFDRTNLWDYSYHRRHSPLYFTNFLNLDSRLTLSTAAEKYQQRGFPARLISTVDCSLHPGDPADLQHRFGSEPGTLASELEMSAQSMQEVMSERLGLTPIAVRSMLLDTSQAERCFSRNDVVGWMMGLSGCKLYKFAVTVTDMLLPEQYDTPQVLFIRWIGARIRQRGDPNDTALPHADPGAAFSKPMSSGQDRGERERGRSKRRAKKPVRQQQTVCEDAHLTSELALLGLTAADVPWRLVTEFNGRYGAAFALAPLLLSISDVEYRNVFQLPTVFAAAYTSASSSAEPSGGDSKEDAAAYDGLSDIEPDVDVDEKHGAEVSRVIKHRRLLRASSRLKPPADGDDSTTEQRDYEQRRSSPVPLTALQRYCILQLTRALLHNGEISADRLTSFYPWCVRYFQAKYIRCRRALRRLMAEESAVMPLVPELMQVVADHV